MVFILCCPWPVDNYTYWWVLIIFYNKCKIYRYHRKFQYRIVFSKYSTIGISHTLTVYLSCGVLSFPMGNNYRFQFCHSQYLMSPMAYEEPSFIRGDSQRNVSVFWAINSYPIHRLLLQLADCHRLGVLHKYTT